MFLLYCINLGFKTLSPVKAVVTVVSYLVVVVVVVALFVAAMSHRYSRTSMARTPLEP